MEVMGIITNSCSRNRLLSTILRKNINQKLSHTIGLEKRAASGCRRGHETTYGLIGELGAFSPGLKAGSWQDKAFSPV
jgi:hypothetical protein